MQSTTKVSPGFLNFGRDPRTMKSLRREVGAQSGGLQLIERVDLEVWKDRMKRHDQLRDMVAKNFERVGDEQKRLFNK